MRQVLVIGGGGGLGSAIVTQLLDREMAVVVGGRTRPVDGRVRHSYLVNPCDLDWLSFYRTVEQDTRAPIDGLVFVAGLGAFGKTSSIPVERARAIFDLNFWACTSAAARIAEHWSNGGRSGTFVAVLSLAARRAVPFEAYYCASKAAADKFLQCLDLEYAPKGIRFVSALPGVLNTPFRERAEWYGVRPDRTNNGLDVRTAARAIEGLLNGRRKAGIIGWRERVIDLADRLAPGLYEQAVLRRRIAKLNTQT
jgi:short-subunit dehydrogenase